MPPAERDRFGEGLRGGAAVLERLAMPGASLESAQVAGLLGAKNARGIGSAFHHLKSVLHWHGIGLGEAVCRSAAPGGSIWTAGPRIEQARHVADLSWRMTEDMGRFRNRVPMETPAPGCTDPVLVLRALYTEGEAFRFPNFDTLRELVDDRSAVRVATDCGVRGLGEVFIHRIEPGHDGALHKVPEGYGEHGLWIRGEYDYCDEARTWDPARCGDSEVFALVCDLSWVERRVVLVDAVRQWEQAGFGPLGDGDKGWSFIRPGGRYRAVKWISHDLYEGRRPPPVPLRPRCWHELHIDTDRGIRAVLREEGLRGDRNRTMVRAVSRWRRKRRERSGMHVTVRDVRVSGRQPRPAPL